jgi:hypothetical protein
VVEPVPHPRPRLRLLGVDLLREVRVEAPEVDQLARAVDLRLVRRLALAEHGGGVQDGAVARGEELGGAEEDGEAVFPRPVHPVALGLLGGGDRLANLVGAALVVGGEDVPVVVRHHLAVGVAGADLAPADDERESRSLPPPSCPARP